MDPLGWLDKAISAVSPKWGLNRQINQERQRFLADTTIPNNGAGSLGNYYGPYTGAQSTRTSTPWFISPTDPKFRFASHVAMREMRNRARTLEKNNEIAGAMLDRAVENVVGPIGFQLKVTSENPAWTQEKNADWSKRAEKLMGGWFPGADISGLPWVEHQKVVFRSFLRDGDILTILDRDGYLQGVEADLIESPSDESIKKKGVTNTILFGVEVDQFNNPRAFWVKALPTEQNKSGDPVRFDEKDCIFFSNRTRFGQIRGITIFTTIFDLLDQICSWKIATLMAARIAACFGIAISQEDPRVGPQTTTNSAGQQQSQENIEPGMILRLKKGETATTINPSNPGHSFPQNLQAMVRLAGLPFGMPLELVLLDFSGGSYTKSRAAMLQAYRKFQAWQHQFIAGYLKRLYQWRISKFIKAGELEANPDAWNHRWISQPWPFLDPIKELQAVQMGFDTGTDCLTDRLAAHGITLDQYIAKRQAELKKLTAAGIPLLHSQALMQYVTPGSPVPATQTAPQPAPKDSEEDDDDEEDEDLEDEND